MDFWQQYLTKTYRGRTPHWMFISGAKKAKEKKEAKGFFAPYVPLSFTKTTNTESGQPAIIAKTRYALETIPGVESPTSNDRARTYARSFGIDFNNTVLA
jgi:hypothetical protein